MTTAMTPATEIRSMIESRRDTLVQLMPEQAQQDRFIAALMTHVLPRPELHDKRLQPSLMVGLYHLAKLGLDPGVDAHLINRGGVVRCEIGYAGAVKLMMTYPGAKSVHVDLIYQNEEYRIEQGRLVAHVNSLDVKTRGPLIGASARLYLHDGTTIERIIDGDDIARARMAGGAAWKTSESEMVRKTAILRLRKLVPFDPDRQRVLNELEAYEAETVVHSGPGHAPGNLAPGRRMLGRVMARPMLAAETSAPETTAPETLDPCGDDAAHTGE
jgi:recombinational DNA repair protein RecT